MPDGFVNRLADLQQLDLAAARGGLLVVFGRRRVGKTRLLKHWLEARGGLYSQAIEASSELQIAQTFDDLKPQLDTTLVPKSWPELFELLTLQKKRWVCCFDEFPYLTATDPSLPSQLQKWLDHSFPRGCLLVLAGSSTRMMHDLLLHPAAPLYGRASKLLHLQPMDYGAFCEMGRRPAGDVASFEVFACLGGVPKYWELVEPADSPVDVARSLYFDLAPYMEHEPQRLLRDEGVSGLNALAVLEAVGRGAERPSEIGARLGTPQTNLSRLLQQLIDASILTRELPFGESLRSTKKVLYKIQDPAVRFWFRVYSPHRSRWDTYSLAEQAKLVRDHAASVFEDCWRARFPGSGRFWERGVELDLVAPDPIDRRGLLVAEIKWRRLSAAERREVERQLHAKWARSALAARHPRVRFDVFDAGRLKELARTAASPRSASRASGRQNL